MKTLNQILNTTEPGRYATSQRTLYVNVHQAVDGRITRSWVQRISIQGQPRNLGLGPVDVKTFKEAKQEAFENRAAVYQGRNPLAEKAEEKRLASTPTFAACVDACFKAHRARWGTPKTASKWLSLFSNHVPASVGTTRIDKVTSQQLHGVLLHVQKSAPSSARRLKQAVVLVCKHSIGAGWITTNPAENLVLPKTATRNQVHHASMGYRNVPSSFKALETSCSNVSARNCLRLIMLTAVRLSEARAATWSEIDLAAKVWTIPAERMKMSSAHRVPLSEAALEVLKAAEKAQDGSGLVFPSPFKVGGLISDKLLMKALRASVADGVEATIHGLRSCFRDWAGETGESSELAEAQLAHVRGSVEAAYFRSDILSRRVAMMERYGAYVSGQRLRGKVVSIAA